MASENIVGKFPTVKVCCYNLKNTPTKGGFPDERQKPGIATETRYWNMNADLRNAVLSILNPLIRYLIGRGTTYPLMVEVLKEVYVKEALRQAASRNEPITDSRVSLLTGIHRKDVKRLRTERPKEANPPALRRGASLAARVVAEWVSTPRYLDSRGKPKPLAVHGVKGKLTFETLVKKVKADMRPAVVLDELVRAGVAKLECGIVRLQRSAYVPEQPRDKLAFLGANVGDHLQSALHNITGKQPPFIERAVYYGLIDAKALQQAQPDILEHAERFLQEINRVVMPLNATAIRQRVKNGRRMRLGVYYYEDDGFPAPARVISVRQRKKTNDASDEH